ncbi:MAG TPA: DUF2520 domain-containing protein [Terriglobales bacterium]|nr:DUF2520 domain-containing protein [Terriglobales bacterium]
MPARSKSQKYEIAIIGAGTLASALARALHSKEYRVSEIVSRSNPQSLRRARILANRIQSSATTIQAAEMSADIVWICVPDDAIAALAEQMTDERDWRGKIVVHSSGALSSDTLELLRRKGAEVASAHPLMTFVSSSQPKLKGVPFALEGTAKALTAVETIISDFEAHAFRIARTEKAAYHAFGFFSSPGIVALIAAAIEVGKLAGLEGKRVRALMEPIVRQTIDNCFRTSPQQAFSGPVRRGDVETIRKHLKVLDEHPDLLDLYGSLVRIALKDLPSANTDSLQRLVNKTRP